MTQDWFAQNAPQQQTGGDWFAQNAPESSASSQLSSSGQPQGALEQFRSESIGGRLLDVPGALAATAEAGKGILKGAGKTVANLADSALTLNRFTPSSLAMSTAAKLTKTPDINAQATSTAQNAIQDVSQRYLSPANREQKAGYYGEGAAEIVLPMLKGIRAAAAVPKAMKAAASTAFDEVGKVANPMTFDLTDQPVAETALRMKQLSQRGFSLPKPVNDFLKRATDINGDALNYEELRDFASKVGNLSADEAMKIDPKMRFLLSKFGAQLDDATAKIATSAGKAEQFAQAMGGWARAMKYQKAIETLKEFGIDAAKLGIGTGLTGLGLRYAVNWSQGK